LLENDILWESADENIATVDSEGNVTGINYGETDITAKYHNNEWSCHIIVNNIIPLDKTTLEWILYKYGCDTNGDGLLSTEEASSITELDLTTTDYSNRPDYTGPNYYFFYNFNTKLLPFFINLESLYIWFDEYRKDCDIMINGINHLKFLYISTYEFDNHNDYSIIIKDLPSLETLKIETLSKIELYGLYALINLELCTFHEKKSIAEIVDISKLPKLEKCQIVRYVYGGDDIIEIIK